MLQNGTSAQGGTTATGRTSEVNLQRAVVIGIGGTGGEVIRRLRRLIVDRFGSFENLPIVRFLYIDTDINWIQSLRSEIEEDIQLSESEFVDIEIPNVTGLYEGIAAGDYPNYSWFSHDKLKTHHNITNGAGTIRQLGRLAFWQHQDAITRKFEALVRDLNHDRHADFMRDKYGQTIDPGINIHIIAGLAGGTGSGCFLDMAYLARNVVSRRVNVQGAHQYAGYLAMPSAFVDVAGAVALPNGYAALKELNYFHYRHAADNPLAALYGEPEWRAEYTQGAAPVEFRNEFPFDFCYLLDSSNDHVQLSRNHIFAMLARSLFHEFTLEFARVKRSLRANIDKQMTSNDPRDCPARFMSFGQSAIYFPLREVKEVLAHQLALRAVQRWVDSTAQPIKVLSASDQGTGPTPEATLASLSKTADSEAVQSSVRGHLIGEFIPNKGFKAADVLAAVVADERTRLTDVPYQLKENEKQAWINEKWERDQFKPRLSAAWERWQRDFNDTGPDPTTWGEQIRWMVANRETALNGDRQQKVTGYRRKIHDNAMEMFHDPKRGPAWALAFVRMMRGPVGALKQRYLDEANNAAHIAEQLGDMTLLNAAQDSRGPSLSAIIEQRIGQEFQELDEVLAENPIRSIFFKGEDRMRLQAEEYLKWCALWCRARVEERSRRLASELCESLLNELEPLERKIRDTASVLSQLQTRATQLAQIWAQKGAATENVGKLLYDPFIVDELERKIQEWRGDAYDASRVGQRALQKTGIELDQLKEGDVEKLLQALVVEAEEALGDISEEQLTDTRFAAYDLLAAQCRDRGELESALSDTARKGAPFVRLDPNPLGGPINTPIPMKAVGLRGGHFAKQLDKDQDIERVRVMEALSRMGWNLSNEIAAIGESEQIVFVHEIGGFPLRALTGITEMRDAYDRRRQSNKSPLHIVRDEMAERFPDIFPPRRGEDLERALTLKAVAPALEVIVPRDFPHPDGNGKTVSLLTYLRHIAVTNEEDPMPLGETPDAVAMKLAYDSTLAAEVEGVLKQKIVHADESGKRAMAERLKATLEEKKKQVAKGLPLGVRPETQPAYTQERDRVVRFMQDSGLSVT
jgi:hypothetical protein